MTVNIEEGASFLGVPMTKVRGLLRAWRFGDSRDPDDIARLKHVSLKPTTIMVLLDELRDRGFIGEERNSGGELVDPEGLTETGTALATAVARRRIGREVASDMLGRFLERCSAANANAGPDFTVEAVWLFGDILGDRDEVADVDVAIDVRFHGKVVSSNKHAAQRRAFERALIGNNRPYVLAVRDVHELINLGYPCKLVFERTRGGRIGDGMIVSRHPQSPQHDVNTSPTPGMPDLKAFRKPLRPLPAKFFPPRGVHIRDSDRWARDMSPDRPRHRSWQTLLVTDDQPLPVNESGNDVIRHVDWSNLDGRDRLGLVKWEKTLGPNPFAPAIARGKNPCFAGVFSRMISIGSGTVVYTINVEACVPNTGLDEATAEAVALWISELCVADIEHGVRRSNEAGNPADTVDLRCQNRTGSISGDVVSRVLREELLFGRDKAFAKEFELRDLDFTISAQAH